MSLAKADLEKLAECRLEDARVLLNSRRYSAAYYLAGYSIELALKACIAKQFRQDVIPDKNFVSSIYSHKLEDLIRLAGLKKDYTDDISENPRLKANWALVFNWSESKRYESVDQFEAISLVYSISDHENGVLSWIKKYW